MGFIVTSQALLSLEINRILKRSMWFNLILFIWVLEIHFMVLFVYSFVKNRRNRVSWMFMLKSRILKIWQAHSYHPVPFFTCFQMLDKPHLTQSLTPDNHPGQVQDTLVEPLTSGQPFSFLKASISLSSDSQDASFTTPCLPATRAREANQLLTPFWISVISNKLLATKLSVYWWPHLQYLSFRAFHQWLFIRTHQHGLYIHTLLPTYVCVIVEYWSNFSYGSYCILLVMMHLIVLSCCWFFCLL
jgi:hypothetical protein